MSSDDQVPIERVVRTLARPDDDPEFEAFFRLYAPVLSAGLDDGALMEDADGELVGRVAAEDDVALAALVADRLFTEESALRLFPAEARERLGDPERWRWVLVYVRCCWMFSWLVCRGCRDFRAIAWYLFQYVRCLRAAVGTPLEPGRLSEDERADLGRLFTAFGEVYTEYLESERVNVRLSASLTDELIFGGRFDCCRDDRFTALIFDRLLTAENAPLILGRKSYAARQNDAFFWLSRCWCMAAIRFGCCLACARSRAQLLECWRRYRGDLVDCWTPPHCALTYPTGCVSDELEPMVNGFGVPVIGTAAGSFFGGYVIEWRKSEGELVNVDGAAAAAACSGGDGWSSDNVVYPGGGSYGAAPVVNGIVGWLDTTNATARAYDIRICLRPVPGAPPPPCCCIQFNLFRHLVWISHVAGLPVQAPNGRFDATSPIVNTNPGGHVMSVGCCFSVRGSAWVGECNDRMIQCFDLRYAVGCLPGPDQKGFDPTAYVGSCLPTPVCYGPPDENEKRAPWNQVFAQALTTQFVQMSEILIPGGPVRKWWELRDLCWDSRGLAACVDLDHTCQSGQYTLLIDVEDTQGNHYYDTQCIWIDNKPIHAVLRGFEGVKSCAELSLRELNRGQGCAQKWLVPLMGIAFDEYIVESDHSRPSDNFDSYDIWIARGCGGPWYQVPITPDFVQWHKDLFTGQVTPWQGHTRVGEPGTRCEQVLGCPTPAPTPTTPITGVLTAVDLRIFDAVCAASMDPQFRPPPGFALQRGECCGYAIQLTVRDNTRSDYTGNCHTAVALCAICICNDLPPVDGLQPVDPALTHPLLAAPAGAGEADAPSPQAR
ncbi:MAG TPA: hypothetical protein VFT45_26650 [Longimicrobium sp.]|nr:hypothetical protein [Longimicrobium sp.]